MDEDFDDFDDFDDEDSLLGSTERQGEEVKPWNTFKVIHRKTASGSTVENKLVDNGVKFLKIATIFITFLVVLGTAVLSKGLILLMTSQIKKNVTRNYCNKGLDISRQYIFSVPGVERATWIWFLMLAYFVPEFMTFFRSGRILLFKTRLYPTLTEFLSLLVTECLPAIGSSLLIFCVLPELDVVKGAMLTNAMCVIPALMLVFTKIGTKKISIVTEIADILALLAQLSAMLAWPLINHDEPILWLIPICAILISFGWWENFVPLSSPIKLVRQLAKSRKEFPTRKYFCYFIISSVKCIIFFATTIACIYFKDGDVNFLFENFSDIFWNHPMTVTEVVPQVTGTNITVDDAISTGIVHIIYSDINLQAAIWGVSVVSAYACYAFGKFACKIMIQGSSFAFPIALTVPFLISALVIFCGFYAKDVCAFYDFLPAYLFFNSPPLLNLLNFVETQHPYLWLFWLLSQIWITRHIWTNNNSKLASTEKLFMRPMYDGILIDQSIAMNRRNVVDKLVEEEKLADGLESKNIIDENKITRIYACATMWHETPEEMMEFFKSIFRMDEDQACYRISRQYLQYPGEGYYEWETHIFFDDAYLRKSVNDNDPMLNSYVNDFIATMPKAAEEVHKTTVKIRPPTIYPTPYGGRLIWVLPGRTKLIVHLKDKAKIRAKKRWSQVMYMYYLLGHKLMDNEEMDDKKVKLRSFNTYILALDGDIDFQPEAVALLVQYMQKKSNLGAACGRIHPVGSGIMAWYQTFEYAVGHWMQKATEHVIGCVLCSPGCFSLFRASALMDHNVMARYTTRSSEARHYVQYDQGEDRWLCTLLLQRGYRVEYSAASDAYTHCPEGFIEFYNQRRRWGPSTTANILDLLEDSDHIKLVNDDISSLYIFYQVILMIGTVIGPGTIFLMLVGAFVTVFNVSQFTALWLNVGPILFFVLTCIICKSDTQLMVAAILSAIYGLVMIMVLIGVAMQIYDDGVLAPSSLFFFLMMGEYVVAAMLHPKEFYCLKYGAIYLITVPSMYMLLIIYSVFNMNNVSWGTRDVSVAPPLPEGQPKPPPKKEKSFVEDVLDKMKKFFMACCSGDSKHLVMISNSLTHIQSKVEQNRQKVEDLERITLDPDAAVPRKTMGKRKTTIIEGSRASRQSLRKSTMNKPGAIPNENANASIAEDDEEDYDEEESIGSSDDLQNNSWFYAGELLRGRVTFLDKKEEKFWKELLDAYLHPIEDDKEKVAKDLKDLRDRMTMSFFALNVFFVTVVFLLTIKKDILHLNWPFNPTVNFTYSAASSINEIVVEKTYLQLEPIGFVFLIFFFALMGCSSLGCCSIDLARFPQIMANTDVEFGEKKIENLTEDELLEKDSIKIVKKLVKLKGINGDDEKDEEVDAHVSRRKTVADLAKNKDRKRAVINDLDSAF
uniref:chitin synthase n=1 Tax=Anthonomus grandis TaxID=7044 RepID=A0A0F6N0B4_ANTGR|nr:chitin synthase II [Anthonomus grandis]